MLSSSPNTEHRPNVRPHPQYYNHYYGYYYANHYADLMSGKVARMEKAKAQFYGKVMEPKGSVLDPVIPVERIQPSAGSGSDEDEDEEGEDEDEGIRGVRDEHEPPPEAAGERDAHARRLIAAAAARCNRKPASARRGGLSRARASSRRIRRARRTEAEDARY